MRRSQILALATLLAIVACTDSPMGPLPRGETRDAVIVVNDPGQLALLVQSGHDANVTIFDDSPPLVLGDSLRPATGRRADLASSVVLELEAIVAAPEIDGLTLQATDVAFADGGTGGASRYAYVTYAMLGEATLGAVDVFQVTGGENAVLRSRVLFTDADVYSAAVADGRLYLATSSSDPQFTERAVLEVVQLASDGRLPETYASRRYQLPSFVATAVHVQNGNVWVVSGTGGVNTGGLTVFRSADMQRLTTVTLDDARGVGGNAAEGTIVVTQGRPGRTRVFGASTLAPIGDVVASGGAETAEARGDVAVDGHWAFVASSEGGTAVLHVDRNGATLSFTLPAPVIADMQPELRAVNGVTTLSRDGDAWIFTANGAAGVYAYYSDHASIDSTQTPSLSMMGRLTFPEWVSANFAKVDQRGEWLVVAAGLGGIRLVEILD